MPAGIPPPTGTTPGPGGSSHAQSSAHGKEKTQTEGEGEKVTDDEEDEEGPKKPSVQYASQPGIGGDHPAMGTKSHTMVTQSGLGAGAQGQSGLAVGGQAMEDQDNKFTRYIMNFDPELAEIICEAKYLELLGFPVPELARSVALQV